MAKENIITVEEYARRCGVSRSAIYGRIARGILSAVNIYNESGNDKALYVDAKSYPPKRLRAGRKKFGSNINKFY